MTDAEWHAYNRGVEAARARLDRARRNVTIEHVGRATWDKVVDVLDDELALLMQAEPDNDPEARRRAFALVQA